MAHGEDRELEFNITIEWEEDEPPPPSPIDIAAHSAVSTIHNIVMIFIFLIPIGWIISLRAIL
jgi:hypothetical protein